MIREFFLLILISLVTALHAKSNNLCSDFYPKLEGVEISSAIEKLLGNSSVRVLMKDLNSQKLVLRKIKVDTEKLEISVFDGNLQTPVEKISFKGKGLESVNGLPNYQSHWTGADLETYRKIREKQRQIIGQMLSLLSPGPLAYCQWSKSGMINNFLEGIGASRPYSLEKTLSY